MSQITSHRLDSSDTQEQIDTTNIALKSQVGQMNREYNNVIKAIESNTDYYNQVNNAVFKLTNSINNLIKACSLLAATVTSPLNSSGYSAEVQTVKNKWGMA